MAAQWDEEQKLEEILDRRRMEGSSLHVEVMHNVLELYVHERMSQGTGVKGFKAKKKVSMVCERDEGKAEYRCGGRY